MNSISGLIVCIVAFLALFYLFHFIKQRRIRRGSKNTKNNQSVYQRRPRSQSAASDIPAGKYIPYVTKYNSTVDYRESPARHPADRQEEKISED